MKRKDGVGKRDKVLSLDTSLFLPDRLLSSSLTNFLTNPLPPVFPAPLPVPEMGHPFHNTPTQEQWSPKNPLSEKINHCCLLFS